MRVIDQLRKLFPGEWHYRHPVWEHEGGWNVYACAAYSPRWDHDDGDEAFSTHYYRSDSGARIYLGTCVNLEFPPEARKQ